MESLMTPDVREQQHNAGHSTSTQQTQQHTVEPGDIAIGVIVGRASEYFDFFVYAIASALVFPAVFFPFAEKLQGTLLSFAIFAFAFLARPFGTVLFMRLEQRFGRQIKLTTALVLLGTCTAGMAFLPGYNDLGKLAIVMLAALRIGQGFALGGAWDGLPSLLAIRAPKEKRAWYAMLGQMGAPFGFITAAGIFAYMMSELSSSDFLSWGWRYPFYVAFSINVVALFARLRIVSIKLYADLLDTSELKPCGIDEISRTQGRNVLVGALVALASYALFHVVTVFPLSWIALNSTRSITDFLIIQMGGAVMALVGVALSGVIAMRIGRRNMLGGMAGIIGVFSFFVPALVTGGETAQNGFIIVGYLILGLSYGQAAGAVTSNFLPHYRYTGAALTSDLAWLVGAGFAPLVALGVCSMFGPGWLTVYLLSAAVATIVALSINRIFTDN